MVKPSRFSTHVQGVKSNDNFKYIRYYYSGDNCVYVLQLPHQDRYYYYEYVNKGFSERTFDSLLAACGAFNSAIMRLYRPLIENGLQQTLFETNSTLKG